MTFRAAVALGSNLGDRLSNLRRAVEGIRRLGEVTRISSLYETAPVGGPDQGPYLNAMVLLETDLEPEGLLAELARIEAAAGRVRGERWGPRTLDLDLITMIGPDGPVRRQTADLELPHPRATGRAFVLAPLDEVWPGAPLGEMAAADARRIVGEAGIERLGTAWAEDRTGLARALVLGQFLLLGGYVAVVWKTARTPLATGTLLAGSALAGSGGLLMAWATLQLGSAVTALPEPRTGTQLATTGPYRFLRHPIYVGLVWMLAGVALAVRSIPALLGAGLVAAYLVAKARYEETRLRIKVNGYPDYQRRVGGFLPRIPSL